MLTTLIHFVIILTIAIVIGAFIIIDDKLFKINKKLRSENAELKERNEKLSRVSSEKTIISKNKLYELTNIIVTLEKERNDLATKLTNASCEINLLIKEISEIKEDKIKHDEYKAFIDIEK